jgi:hypothetical protein
MKQINMMKNLIKKFNMLSEYVELNGSNCDWKSVQVNLSILIEDVESLITTLRKDDNLYEKLQEVYFKLETISNMLTEKKYNVHERISDIKHFIDTYFYE